VISSAPRLWIKASPRGTRSGFAVLPDGAGGRVTVTVLPKPWSTSAQVVRDYDHAPGSTTHVVMHETELAVLSTTAACVGALTMSLTDVSREQGDLLALGTPPDHPLSAPSVGGDPFRELIDLMLLAERGSLTSSPLTFEGAFAPSLLRILMQERLLSVVEGLIFRVRPRYAERAETLEMPRGRLRESSLLYSLVTSTPRVESTFDELTTDTPLLQVVASALRVIGSDRLPRKIASLRPGLQTRAVHLLRYLSGVTLIDRERALLAAESLWLGPLDQIWKPAIDAAMPVLRDWAVAPEPGASSTETLLVHVSTEKFWEQCMELVLESAFRTVAVSRDAHAGEGVSVPAPWVPRAADGTELPEPATTSFPDFMLRSGRRVVVADAKYKLGTGSAPTSSDGYQLFAYSHLATLGGRLSDVAVLLYPTRVDGRPTQLELERLRDRHCSLWLVRLPFPTRRDIQSQGSWTAYVARLAAAMRDLSTDWDAGLRWTGTGSSPGYTGALEVNYNRISSRGVTNEAEPPSLPLL
jgi:McrBC 5-methylcytosine restriction system component